MAGAASDGAAIGSSLCAHGAYDGSCVRSGNSHVGRYVGEYNGS